MRGGGVAKKVRVVHALHSVDILNLSEEGNAVHSAIPWWCYCMNSCFSFLKEHLGWAGAWWKEQNSPEKPSTKELLSCESTSNQRKNLWKSVQRYQRVCMSQNKLQEELWKSASFWVRSVNPINALPWNLLCTWTENFLPSASDSSLLGFLMCRVQIRRVYSDFCC